MNIYFVRHGETLSNANHTLAGHLDVPLDEKGIDQAKSAAEDILKKQISIDKIFTSPLGRATETADIIAKHIGYKPENISIDYELIERDFGVYSGQPMPPTNLLTYFIADHDHPSVETINHLLDRAKRVISDMQTRFQNDENVLLVSHSIFGEALIATSRNYKWGDMQLMHKPPNGKIIKL